MIEEAKITEITDEWDLYQKGKEYNQGKGMYEDTDRNNRFYDGDQWQGLESGSIAPVTKNIIRPIVKYKVGNVMSSDFAINYSAENWDDEEFQKEAENVCDLLIKHSARIWEKDHMDYKLRRTVKRACINSEGIIYVDNDEDNNPIHKLINKNNVFYGNENSSDIQSQPYILITMRTPLSQVIEEARKNGVSEENIKLIATDSETREQAGDESKKELNDKVLVITKLWKKDGTVWAKKSTKQVVLEEEYNTELTLYPLAHIVWEEVEGSSRGNGEVKYIIPNQIEINKSTMRILIAEKYGAYPQKVVNIDKIVNPKSVNKMGETIYIKDMTVDDLKKYIGFLQPAPMSSDARVITSELMTDTRELAGAGDIATGNVNPEQASGRSILAVQQANQLPLNEHLSAVKMFIEDLGRIYIDQWKTYNTNGMTILDEEEVEEVNNEGIKKKITKKFPKKISSEVLKKLKATVKIDVTPKSSYDKFAVEMSLENLLSAKQITFEEYVKALPYDSVMPKTTLEDILANRQIEQQKINIAEKQAIDMQNQMSGYLKQNEEINNIDQEGQTLISQMI